MSGTTNSIPASYFVGSIPSVISAGGTGLAFVELFLSNNVRTPIGSILTFPTLASVQAYYGATSMEAIEAAVYFGGYTTATQLPGALLITQYPTSVVGAYLRGGPVSSYTLTELQAFSGVLDVTIDGVAQTSTTINLSSATSFSSAAQLMSAGFSVTGPSQGGFTASIGATFTGAASASVNLTVTSVTGVIHIGGTDTITGPGISGTVTIVSQTSGPPGGAGVYVTSAATSASGAVVATSTVMDVTAVASGAIQAGQQIEESGITSDTFVGAWLTGSPGGIGTYSITHPWQIASSTTFLVNLPVVTYDTLSGAFVISSGSYGATSTMGYASGSLAGPLMLTQATGAVTSQGAAAATPIAFMTAIVAQNPNFVTFQTIFDPDGGSGNANKLLFAQWTNSTNDQYVYLCTDTDITPTESTTATTSLGYILGQSNSSGTVPIYQPVGADLHLAAFAGGFAASLNYNATNGRATADYKSQSGISPSVYSAVVAANLEANNYNYYAAVANRGNSWQFFDPGSITGPFQWYDSYLDQIWLNNQCQNALMTLVTQVGRIPYTGPGYTMIRTTLTAGAGGQVIQLPPASPVAAALNNGVITSGVSLSGVETIAANTIAGMVVAPTIEAQGWYLVIQPATPAIRQARLSPTMILLYTDGESLQRLQLASVLIQ